MIMSCLGHGGNQERRCISSMEISEASSQKKRIHLHLSSEGVRKVDSKQVERHE